MLATAGLRGFSIVMRDDSAESLLAFDFPFGRGCKIKKARGQVSTFNIDNESSSPRKGEGVRLKGQREL